MAQKKAKQSFEDAIKELEGIVARLEGGGISLEEAVSLYEKGSFQAEYCEKLLDEYQGKINILLDGQEEPYDEGQQDEQIPKDI